MPSYIGSAYVMRPRACDPDAERFFSAVRAGGSRVSEKRQRLYDDLIRRLKLGGVWSLLDTLYILAAADATAALINVRNPGVFDLTAVNSPTFTVDRGYTGDGVTSYLDSNFSPSTAGGQFSQNSAHFSARSLTHPGSAGRLIGDAGGSSAYAIIPVFGSTMFSRVGGSGDAGFNSGSNTSSIGNFLAYRDGTTVKNCKDGVPLASTTYASSSLTSGTVAYLKGSSFGPYEVASGTIGGALSGAQVAALHAAELAYMQAVGAV